MIRHKDVTPASLAPVPAKLKSTFDRGRLIPGTGLNLGVHNIVPPLRGLSDCLDHIRGISFRDWIYRSRYKFSTCA
jgi:hypothetical protein